MASRVEIVNMALALIAGDSITDLVDEVESARKANAMYAIIRNEVLRAHPWAFATKRATLAKLASTPAFDYAYQYQLPNDCLRVMVVSDGSNDFEDYEIEGRMILTDEDPIYIKYTALITDEGMFDACFTSAFATRLAASLAYPIADATSLAVELMKIYKEQLNIAQGQNSQEAGMPDVIGADQFISARD